MAGLRTKIAILLVALAAAGIAALGAGATGLPGGTVVVEAELVHADGFSDGGDAPDGYVAVRAQVAGNGFSDGGDGFVTVYLRPAGDGFSDGGDLPDGFVPVVAQSAEDGFSDGGDGFVTVLAMSAEQDGTMVTVRLRLAETAQDSPLGGDFPVGPPPPQP